MSRVAALVASCLLFSSAAFASSDAQVVIQNDSLWEIHNLYISATAESEWGPDQLGEEVIAAEGGKFTLTGIPCGAYDVRLVDEDGDECVVGDVGLCAGKDAWVIQDADLLACQAESE